MNIRTRFTLLFALIVGIILFLFSFAIYYLSEDYRQNDFHSRLQDRAISKLKLVIAAEGKPEKFHLNNIEESKINLLKDEKIIIYNSDKEIIYKDSATALPTLETINLLNKQKLYVSVTNKEEIVGIKYSYIGNNYFLFAKAQDEYGTKFINNLKRTLIFRGLIIMLLIVLSGWLYAGRFLKPISKIVQQADKITYSNLNYRLSTKNKNDEIGRLTATFNKMLERLETSFKIQKRFVSNASHELRNPLTAISGQIEVALLKERNPEEYKSVLNSISKEIKNVRTLANNLLELANSEAETIFKDSEEIRIDELLWNVRDEMLKLKPEFNIQINFDQIIDNEKLITCRGKVKLLSVAFLNIIENACKFSKNKTVEIKVLAEKNNIILYFIDNGIGMPETYLKHAFEPFFRGSNTHGISGSGIGLSLVQRIIKLHSGKIFIRSKINSGTTIEVVLPNLS
ncbi:MAG: HAMP domain-containing histidine kinase [Bacteroidetes bacterium]|nr:HAMP domain-containing histidine kinase [Bacteroidota bacterium]